MKLPVYSPRVWLGIALKVLVLFIIFDVLFGLLHVADRLTAITIYGRLVPYHTRLVVADSDLGHQVMPLNILLKAHEISRPKGANEFRVVVLGESGIVGAGNSDDTTISAQMTAAKQTLHGALIRVYNLGWPTGSATRDLLIADASLAYQPDLIVWFVTLGDFRNDNLDLLVEANSRRMTQLTAQFGLISFAAQTFGHADLSWWSDTFLNQRATIYRWLRWQTYDALRQPNFRVFPAGIIKQFPVPDAPLIKPDDPVFMPMPGPTWDALTVLPQLTAVHFDRQ